MNTKKCFGFQQINEHFCRKANKYAKNEYAIKIQAANMIINEIHENLSSKMSIHFSTVHSSLTVQLTIG